MGGHRRSEGGVGLEAFDLGLDGGDEFAPAGEQVVLDQALGAVGFGRG